MSSNWIHTYARSRSSIQQPNAIGPVTRQCHVHWYLAYHKTHLAHRAAARVFKVTSTKTAISRLMLSRAAPGRWGASHSQSVQLAEV